MTRRSFVARRLIRISDAKLSDATLPVFLCITITVYLNFQDSTKNFDILYISLHYIYRIEGKSVIRKILMD